MFQRCFLSSVDTWYTALPSYYGLSACPEDSGVFHDDTIPLELLQAGVGWLGVDGPQLEASTVELPGESGAG